MGLANTLSAPLWQAAHAAETQDSANTLLYLNVPAWIAPKKPIYRIGTEGLTFIPGYVRVQDFVYVNTGIEPEIRAYMFDQVKKDQDAYIGYAGTELDWDSLTEEIRQVDGVYLTTYTPNALNFVHAGALESGDTTPDLATAAARFEDQILLLDYKLLPSEDGPILHLWWYSLQTPDTDITVFAHIYGENGQLIAQADGYPVLGAFSPPRWRPGDLVHDIRYFTLPDHLEDRDYSIAVGWYDTVTGTRLLAFDEQGQPLAQDAVYLKE